MESLVRRIPIEHLADYISGRELRNVKERRNELFPVYEALGISQRGTFPSARTSEPATSWTFC
jgi:hypothetical protein